MADAIQQSYRAAFFDLIEEEHPIEVPCRAKENISGRVWTPYTAPKHNMNLDKNIYERLNERRSRSIQVTTPDGPHLGGG